MAATVSPDVVRFGAFEFDPATGDLRKARRAIRLQDQSRQVRAMLLSVSGGI